MYVITTSFFDLFSLIYHSYIVILLNILNIVHIYSIQYMSICSIFYHFKISHIIVAKGFKTQTINQQMFAYCCFQFLRWMEKMNRIIWPHQSVW